MFDGVVTIFGDVRHIPDLKISKGALVLMKGQRRSTQLYVLHGPKITSDATITAPSFKGDDVTRL